MGNAAWKDEERKVAFELGLRRKPLSGNSSAGLGGGDVMKLDGTRSDLELEVKSWKRMPLIKHIEKIREEAEGKPFALVIHEKGSHRRFAVIDYKMFVELWKAKPLIKEMPLDEEEEEE